MMTAFAVLDVALHIVVALAIYLWIRQRLQETREETQRVIRVATEGMTPLVAPDPRVDELMRVVSTLKGAEALRQVYGKN